MPSLKNFLGDLGSAVVPAATTAGLTIASGGTINPATLAAIGGAGARGFAGNEAEERRRKQMKRQVEANRRAQAMANLANTLAPGSAARPAAMQVAAPKAGLGEKLAGGVALGEQVFQTARGLKSARDLQAAQREGLEADAAMRRAEAEDLERRTQYQEMLRRRGDVGSSNGAWGGAPPLLGDTFRARR